MKTLVVTADDFGLDVSVNEAVERGHARGVLTAASLMVTAPAAADAVERARRLPNLGVGLHIVLVDGVPALPPGDIPDLVRPDGRFTAGLFGKGVAIFCLPRVRRQMEAEVNAQFEAFRDTGLVLDHVNGHQHFHMHPSIVEVIVKMADRYGVPAVRVPREPVIRSWRAQRDGTFRRAWISAFHFPRAVGMARKLRGAGLGVNDWIFGLCDSGKMTERRILSFLRHLPDGVSELYCHPATRRWTGPENLPAEYMYEAEAEALTSPRVAALIEELGIDLVPFAAAAGPVAR